MKLLRPIKSYLVSQKFGAENTFSAMLEFYKSLGLKGHNGIDMPCIDGDPLYFNCFEYEGKVIELSLDEKAGIGIVIGIRTPYGCYKTIYWHLRSIVVKLGETVSTGQLLGYNDNTGMSTGTHLHFGLKKADSNFNTINRDNGYNGAINPKPYYNNIYVKDYMKNLYGQISIIKKIIKLIKDFLN